MFISSICFSTSRFPAGGYSGLKLLMQGLKISSFDRTNTETILLSNFSRAADAGQIVLVRAVLGRQDCVPLGTLSVPAACSGRWAALVTECPCKGAISGRC